MEMFFKKTQQQGEERKGLKRKISTNGNEVSLKTKALYMLKVLSENMTF